jgi:hypothetical protein
VTLVTGADAEPELVEELTGRTRRGHDGVDVEVLVGGQRRYPLLIGVE